jgi:arylsulfatase A-like enzyme
VRDPRWKLVRYLEPGVGEELYDLQNDPEELVNLAGKREHAEALKEMRDKLDAELKRTEAGW